MSRRPRVSPDRILDAAAVEFAARGFGGARVDRIARRARVNKAMLYYHFKSKEGLYRSLLRRTFATAAARLGELAAAPGTASDKVDRVIAGIAELMSKQPHFAPIMLREVAEGGAHLDRETLVALSGVPRAVSAIVQEGVAAGQFRPVNPLFAYFTMLAPIVFYLAATPIRREIGALPRAALDFPSSDVFVQHMQDALRRALAHEADAPARPPS
jgi:TetR/AcrR family transcriptional regulator